MLFFWTFYYVYIPTPLLETFRFTRTPNRPTVIVEGVNSSRVPLVWRFSLMSSETLKGIVFFRRRRSESEDERIATSSGSKPFVYTRNEFKAYYEAISSSRSATLVLLDVNNDEENKYTVKVTYSINDRRRYPRSTTDVIVFGKYKYLIYFFGS